jgi:IS5 family transposase
MFFSKRNPYYQYFCGHSNYIPDVPCNATELVHFRNRIGTDGFNLIFKMSVELHGKQAQESTVLHSNIMMILLKDLVRLGMKY